MEDRMTKEQLLNELEEMQRHLQLLDSCRREVGSTQAKYERLLESAPDAMVFIDKEARMVLINAQLVKLFGYTEEDLIRKDVHILVPQRYRDRHRTNVAAYFSNPRPRPMGTGLEIFGQRKDGTEFPADISLSPLETDGKLLAIASVRDITERKRAEWRIKQNYEIQAAISSILKISLEPISLDEQLGRVIDLILAIPGLSPHARAHIYLAENQPEMLVLRAPHTVPDSQLPPCERISFGRCVCGKAVSRCAYAFVGCLDGRHEIRFAEESPHAYYCVPIVSAGQTLGLINVVLEKGHERTTEEETFLVAVANTLAAVIVRQEVEAERNKFREQLAETEKLAALGRVAANVAHEIRNPLAAIGGFARRLEKRIAAGSKEDEYAKFIVTEVSRLERILQSILSLSRGAGLPVEQCRLREIAEEAVRIFEEVCKERSIAIERIFADIPAIWGERERILEAIENIISNAIDAMSSGGLLTIATGEEVIKGIAYVFVRISDTGKGIGEEKMHMIFEPFFTSRPQGIGLGLSIVKRFVEDHGGMVHVESTVGAGSTFVLYFPINAKK